MGESAISGIVWLMTSRGYSAFSTGENICIPVPSSTPQHTDSAKPSSTSCSVAGKCSPKSSSLCSSIAVHMAVGAGRMKAGTSFSLAALSQKARVSSTSRAKGPYSCKNFLR
ncbi:hypothetical protein D3C74_411450 [compost metagenome]